MIGRTSTPLATRPSHRPGPTCAQPPWALGLGPFVSTLAIWSLSLPLLAIAACTFVSKIDVCDRVGPTEADLNQRTEGDQDTSPQSLVRVPGDGALLAFTSRDVEGRTELRRARLDEDATSLPTCEQMGEPTIPAPAADSLDRDNAAVAFGDEAAALGIIVYREIRANGLHRLWLSRLTENGCVDDGFGLFDPVLVAEAEPGEAIGFVRAAPLGPSSYLLAWQQFQLPAPGVVPRLVILGRVFGLADGGRFLETSRDRAGGAVPLAPDGDSPGNLALVGLPGERFGMLWYEYFGGGSRVRFAVMSATLDVVAGPVAIDQAMGAAEAYNSLALAYANGQFFAAWISSTGGDLGVARGAFFDDMARPLRSERSSDGSAFRLSSVEGGNESDVAATTLPGGGFLAAWTQSVVLADGSSGSDLRAVGFGDDGTVLFSNRACDRSDFSLALDGAGDQSRPLLATLDDDTILVVHTSRGGATNDRSGTGLRGVGLRRTDLFVR